MFTKLLKDFTYFNIYRFFFNYYLCKPDTFPNEISKVAVIDLYQLFFPCKYARLLRKLRINNSSKLF